MLPVQDGGAVDIKHALNAPKRKAEGLDKVRCQVYKAYRALLKVVSERVSTVKRPLGLCLERRSWPRRCLFAEYSFLFH
jgi:hypothetical protein